MLKERLEYLINNYAKRGFWPAFVTGALFAYFVFGVGVVLWFFFFSFYLLLFQ